MERKLLVVGAAPSSIGAEVVRVAQTTECYQEVLTAGISGEGWFLDVRYPGDIAKVIDSDTFTDVVCTVGVNMPATVDDWSKFPEALEQSMLVNYIGVMKLLSRWLGTLKSIDEDEWYNFVAISSNSAHVPRRSSAAYCASKAALSMGLRVAAREQADAQAPQVNIYGYEPGFVQDTPMSEATEHTFQGKPHRIPGDRVLHRSDLASIIVANLTYTPFGHYANGNMIRIDGGEL